MTLKDAYTQWKNAPRNIVLANRSRDAVQQVLMKKWNDVHLETFTPEFVRQLLEKSSASREMKVKACAILVYVLCWGGDHGYCERPSFDTSIVPAGRDEKPKAERRKPDVCAGCNNVKGCLTCVDGDQWARITEVPEPEPEPENAAADGGKRQRGKAPRRLCKIDPGTLEVVRTYDSVAEACRENGIKAIDSAIKKMQKAGGFYWAYPEDAGSFRERMEEKQRSQTAMKAARAEHARACRDQAAGSLDKQEAAERPELKTVDLGSVSPAVRMFSDQELKDELTRRGWLGTLSKTVTMTLE